MFPGPRLDTGRHDLLDTGHRAHMTDDEQAATVRGSDQCLGGFGSQIRSGPMCVTCARSVRATSQ
jgi:hypothetical protein